MKLPFDKDYFKISLYAVLSSFSVCFAVFIMINAAEILHILLKFILKCLSLAAPVFIGIIIAFLLEPMANFYEKLLGIKTSKKHFFAVIFSFITVFAVIALLGSAVFKSAGSADISELSEKINYMASQFFSKINSLQKNMGKAGIFSSFNGVLNYFLNEFQTRIFRFAPFAVQSVSSFGKIILNTSLGAVLSFYFLYEKEKLLFRLKDINYALFPKKIADCMVIFFRDIKNIFSGYISGQLTDAFIMAVLFSVCFYFGKIKYAVFIGIISGFFNLIPYIGAVAAAVLSSLVSLTDGDISKAIYSLLVIIIVQQIDSAVISPKVVGKSVRLHPVLVIMSLSVFGSLGGVWAMIFAVPVTAVLKLNFDRFINFQKKKRRLKLTYDKKQI